jgi:hypothetical protein
MPSNALSWVESASDPENRDETFFNRLAAREVLIGQGDALDVVRAGL